MEEPRWKSAARRALRAAWPLGGIWRYNRLPHLHPAVPFVVLWSQKAASTTVLKWFFDKAGLLETALAYDPFAHHYETRIFKQQPGYADAVRRALRDPAVPVVKFVRDPAARAFSGYLFLNRGMLFDEDCKDPAAYWRREAVRFARGPGAKASAIFSFNEYLRWLKDSTPRDLDGHLAPQFTGIERPLGDRLSIFRIETIDEAFADLERRHGLPASAADAATAIGTATHHREKLQGADTLARILRDGLPDPRAEALALPEFDTAITQDHPETRDLILSVFAADYAAYPYPPPGRNAAALRAGPAPSP